MSSLSPKLSCCPVRRSAAAGLAQGQASLPPPANLLEAWGCNPSQDSPSSASGLGADSRQLSPLYKVTRRLSLSLAEPGIPAWPWAHWTCQQPSASTWPHPSPPITIPGHCLPHLPRPPGWNFSHSSSHRIQSSQAQGFFCLLLFCTPILASSHSILQAPDCTHLLFQSACGSHRPSEERPGPTACQSRPSGLAVSQDLLDLIRYGD